MELTSSVSAANNMPGDIPARLRRIKTNLQRRDDILGNIRKYFRNEGFLETDTPLRVPVVAPEQYIIPFMSEGWFLSTSPELQMKRLLAAGYEKIFQICHCFRHDERGKHHNPEFTMLEWYRAGTDYLQIINDTELLFTYLARQSGQGNILNYCDNKIDLSLPWKRLTVRDAFIESAGWDPVSCFEAERFDIDLVEKVIPDFPTDVPVVLMDYPAACASLARLKPGDSRVAERAEVFIGGLEIANGYSELNDAREQEERFKLEIEQIEQAGRTAGLPRKFLDEIVALPPCSGIALGVDRLIMLFCDSDSIDDVMAFPVDTL
jgi:elongation factor P--(R)-beta-lysine ligase